MRIVLGLVPQALMALIGFFEILIIFPIVCFIFLFFFTRNNNGLPKNFPILGTLPEILLNTHRIYEWSTEMLEKSHCTFLLKGPWFSSMDILATVDPDNVHYIMNKNFSNFHKGPEFKQIFDVAGDGMFNVDSDSWKMQRKVAVALINHQSFRKFLVKTSYDMRFTFDSTCKTVTGFYPGCLSIEFPEVPFFKAMEDIEEVLLYRHLVPQSVWKLQRWLGFGLELKMKKAQITVDNELFEYIRRKKEESREGIMMKESEGVDLLTSYMNENNTMGLKSDDKFLRDTLFTFISAGRDTISSALTWFFLLLSRNPQVESKIREELESITPAENIRKRWLFDLHDLNNLVYLHGALCEALRLYPPVAFQHKSAVAADVLPSGHRVAPKTKILFLLYAMGRMKSIWGEDCLEFKPERWISENGRMKHEPSYKFLAFNAGPRTCLGKEVSFIQMKAVAANIIHNYEVQVVEGQSFSPNISIILHLKHGLMVRVRHRWVG
ncbi:Cytochrome P450 [Melia azedarach]|uniref:Cytochrome P450 n=1 Tax=Melia azedarach TaxID=155640 RepID=A0ACC1XVT5_MELAZ|nr:Cytochrome P450 [Melia azedarach]